MLANIKVADLKLVYFQINQTNYNNFEKNKQTTSFIDEYSPPLQTPFGSVDHPNPWPQGKTQAKVAFASESCVLLLKIATDASLRTCELRPASRLPRLDETSVFVAAIR